MNKTEAKEIEEKCSLEDIKIMFDNAKNNIKDWKQCSCVNKGLSIGVSYNILSECGLATNKMGRINAIREFGEYLPFYKKVKAKRKKLPPILHEEPNFKNENIQDNISIL